jgi:hypothetical protein
MHRHVGFIGAMHAKHQAAAVMARDPALVRRGLAVTDFDYIYLQQPKRIEALMGVAAQPLSPPEESTPPEDAPR